MGIMGNYEGKKCQKSIKKLQIIGPKEGYPEEFIGISHVWEPSCAIGGPFRAKSIL